MRTVAAGFATDGRLRNQRSRAALALMSAKLGCRQVDST